MRRFAYRHRLLLAALTLAVPACAGAARQKATQVSPGPSATATATPSQKQRVNNALTVTLLSTTPLGQVNGLAKLLVVYQVRVTDQAG